MSCIAEEQFVEILDRGGLDATTPDERTHLETCPACRESWGTLAAAGEILREAASRPTARAGRVFPLLVAAAMLLGIVAVVLLHSNPTAITPKKPTPEELAATFLEGTDEESRLAREDLANAGRSMLPVLSRMRPKVKASPRYRALQDLVFDLRKIGFTDPDDLAVIRKMETLRLDLQFEQTALKDILDFTRYFSGLQLVLDPTLPPEIIAKPVTVNLENATLKEALDLLCTVTDLDFDFRYGVSWFSTPAKLWPTDRLAPLENAWRKQALGLEDRTVADKLRTIRITIDMAEAPRSAITEYLQEISGLAWRQEGEGSKPAISISVADLPLAHIVEILTLPWGLDARIEGGLVVIYGPKR